MLEYCVFQAWFMGKPSFRICLGHEKYQEINGETFPFDDLEELKQSLNIIKQ